MTKVIIY